jgi:predicted esterase
MAACFAIAHPQQVKKLILMAPALNFPTFQPPQHPIATPTYLLIGSLDRITPADIVLPLAEKTFTRLQIELVAEDHLLHQSFLRLDWKRLLFSELREQHCI